MPSKIQNICITLYNVGPTSSTLAQHCINVIQMFCVYWVSVRDEDDGLPARVLLGLQRFSGASKRKQRLP